MPTFLYGTLQDKILRDCLIGRETISIGAYLNGYKVVSQRDALLPALTPAEGLRAEGLLITDLSDAEKAVLDVYETSFDYTVKRLPVSAGGHQIEARVYMPLPSVALSDELWSFTAWETLQGEISRQRAVEIAESDPPMDSTRLRQQWHMIGSRAAARVRAAQDAAPSAVRYDAQAGDYTVLARKPLYGDFFKFCGFELQHRTFQDSQSPVLNREVMVGVDAALALPYDPVSDCILLVEQIRTGPLIRGAVNPWSLEPVAGMVDPGETPYEAAARELEEEASLATVGLEKMFECYASPGGATDYFYCYLALVSLPHPTVYTGGLAEEHEDLRLHVMPFENAMSLIETGEANVGPLISMLLWLSRHRSRLRAAA
ncbi:MAG: NUDIX domain-containing protein [Pseudomonadota bacterium]